MKARTVEMGEALIVALYELAQLLQHVPAAACQLVGVELCIVREVAEVARLGERVVEQRVVGHAGVGEMRVLLLDGASLGGSGVESEDVLLEDGARLAQAVDAAIDDASHGGSTDRSLAWGGR